MSNLTVARAHAFFVGDGQWLVHNQYPVKLNPMIDSGLAKELKKKVGAVNAKKFKKALEKGIVGPRVESGTKVLNQTVFGKYTHELKIGESADRILGYFDDSGNLIFDRLVKGGLH